MSDQWMGSIAAQDQYRPLGNDPWTNTMRGTVPAPGQGFAPETASPVLYQTKAGPITEADIENTIGVGMGVSGGGLSVKDVVKKYPQMKIDVSEARSPNDYGVISRIETPKELRGQGLATKAMQDIVAEADKSSMKLALSPSGDWGASMPRLKDFYSRFGFIPNAGRNKDFATRETMIRSPVMGSLAETAPPPGIKAYHSSPHDFDKFDLAKIGTGEGAQVYGHGLYFAENPAVSGQGGQYWQQFANYKNAPFKKDPVESIATVALQKTGVNREKAIEYLQQRPWDIQPSQYEKAIAMLKSDKPVGPRTYEVNINADPAHMLDWDKSLGQMSPEVQRAIGKIVDRDIPAETGWSKMTGERALRAISERAGVRGGGERLLNEAGIPGIKYLDQGSRGAFVPASRQHMYKPWGGQLDVPKPSSNYVIFDPNIINIMKKYGIAGAAPTAMGALAAQDAYRGDQ